MLYKKVSKEHEKKIHEDFKDYQEKQGKKVFNVQALILSNFYKIGITKNSPSKEDIEELCKNKPSYRNDRFKSVVLFLYNTGRITEEHYLCNRFLLESNISFSDKQHIKDIMGLIKNKYTKDSRVKKILEIFLQEGITKMTPSKEFALNLKNQFQFCFVKTVIRCLFDQKIIIDGHPLLSLINEDLEIKILQRDFKDYQEKQSKKVSTAQHAILSYFYNIGITESSPSKEDIEEFCQNKPGYRNTFEGVVRFLYDTGKIQKDHPFCKRCLPELMVPLSTKQLLEEWYKYLEHCTSLSKNAIDSYKSRINVLEIFLREKKSLTLDKQSLKDEKISEDDLNEFLNSCPDPSTNKSTRCAYQSFFKNFCSFEYNVKNPAKNLKVTHSEIEAAIENKDLRELPKDSDIAELFVKLTSSNELHAEEAYIALLIYVSFGLRFNSVRTLLLKSIEFDYKYPRIRYFSEKSNKWLYAYPRDPEVMEEIREYVQLNGITNPKEPLFKNSNGNVIDENNFSNDVINHFLDKMTFQDFYVKKNERTNTVRNMRKATTHIFRHLYQQDLTDAGADPNKIARLSGHSDINSQQKYIRINEEQKKNSSKNNQLAKKMDEFNEEND